MYTPFLMDSSHIFCGGWRRARLRSQRGAATEAERRRIEETVAGPLRVQIAELQGQNAELQVRVVMCVPDLLLPPCRFCRLNCRQHCPRVTIRSTSFRCVW